MRGGGRSEVSADALSEPTRSGEGGPGRGSPPNPLWVGPKLPVLLPETAVAASVTGRWVPGRGLELDQPPGSLWALPRAGNNSDTEGGEPTVPQVIPV